MKCLVDRTLINNIVSCWWVCTKGSTERCEVYLHSARHFTQIHLCS